MNVRQRIPILLYHSVTTEPAPLLRDWSITPLRFRDHLTALAANGFEGLTVTELVDRLDHQLPLPARPVVITFDDGYRDNLTEALPALLRARLPATVYISTAYVGGDSTWLGPDGSQPMMTWGEIGELDAAGIEIGAHGHHHVPLDELDLDRAEGEIRTSRALLEEHVPTAIRSFAYPHGYHTRRLQHLVHTAGFTSACGVKDAVSDPADDRYGLARIIVPPESTGDDLLRLISDVPHAPRRERPLTVAWRIARRARARVRPGSEPVATP